MFRADKVVEEGGVQWNEASVKRRPPGCEARLPPEGAESGFHWGRGRHRALLDLSPTARQDRTAGTLGEDLGDASLETGSELWGRFEGKVNVQEGRDLGG